MNLVRAIYSELADAAAENVESYNSKYLDLISDIFRETTSGVALRSIVRGESLGEIDEKVRFSLVFNDLTLLDVQTQSKLSIILLKPKWFLDRFGSYASITIATEKLQKIGIEPNNPKVAPVFVFASGDEGNALARTLVPLIRAGRLLLQPARAIMVPSSREMNSWDTHDVSHFSSLENWQIAEEAPSLPTPIASHTTSSRERQLFEVTIPYLRGISFQDFSSILLDEQDLISSLRLALKAAVDSAPTESKISEMVRDTVDPKIDMINRRFRSIANAHAFRVAGTAIGTVALAYTAAATGGLVGAVATIAGSSGIGLLGKEYADYKTRISEIQDDPFYFLWRCKQGERRS
jgi:hypothetical protein